MVMVVKYMYVQTYVAVCTTVRVKTMYYGGVLRILTTPCGDRLPLTPRMRGNQLLTQRAHTFNTAHAHKTSTGQEVC